MPAESAGSFDLHLQAVAGGNIGDSAANYKLRIECIDETLARARTRHEPGELPRSSTRPSGHPPTTTS